MKIFDLGTKQYVDLPEDQAQAGFLSGTHAFHKDELVPVQSSDGIYGRVKASELQGYLSQGGSLANPADVRAKELDDKYGGVGGTLAATGEGALRGLTLGLSDATVVEGARLFGGDSEAEKIRTHLAEEKEAHPYLSTGAEIAGAVAPILLSGGAAAPEELAALGTEKAAARAALGLGEAAGAKPVARGLVQQIMGMTPAAQVGKLGAGVERAAAEVLGAQTGKSAIGRIVAAGAKAAASGTVEGAVFGAGGQLSEDTLGDHELNAEKFIAAMGRGAVLGLLAGAGTGVGLGTLSEAAMPLMRKALPYLNKAAGEQAAKAFDPAMKYLREMDHYGGVAATGQAAIEEGVFSDTIRGAALGHEELSTRLDLAVERRGKELGELRRIHGGDQTGIKAKEIYNELDKTLNPWRSMGVPAAESALEYGAKLRDSVFTNLIKPLKPFGEDVEEVSFNRIFEQRQALRLEAKYSQINPPGTPLPPQTLIARKMAAIMGDFENTAIEAGSKVMQKEGVGAEYKALKLRYAQLQTLQDAAHDAEIRAMKRQSLGAELLAGGHYGLAGGLLGLATGHTAAGMAAGMAAKVAKKLVHERGNALAATVLTKVGKLDLFARAAQEIERDGTEFAAAAAGRKLKPRLRLRRFSGPDADRPSEEKHSTLMAKLSTEQPVDQGHMEAALPGVTVHAPKISSTIVTKLNQSTNYLKSTAPVALNKPSLVDPTPEPRVSEVDAENFYQIAKAVDDPMGTLIESVETGRVSSGQVRAIQTHYPKLFNEVKMKVVDELSQPRDTPLPYEKIAYLSVLFNVDGDATFEQPVIKLLQSTYQPPKPPGPPAGAQTGEKSKPIKGVADSHRLENQKAQTRM